MEKKLPVTPEKRRSVAGNVQPTAEDGAGKGDSEEPPVPSSQVSRDEPARETATRKLPQDEE